MTAIVTCKLLILVSLFGTVAATWSMSGYACNQPQLYSQCNCPSFCGGYMQPQYQQPCGYSSGCGGGGYAPRRRHRLRNKHKKPRRKFRFDSDEDEDVDVPPPRKSKVTRVQSEEQGFIEEESKGAAGKSESSWENEDLWEKKFVTESPRTNVEEKLDSEEFPEITSEEIEEARRARTSTVAPAQTGSSGLGGLGLGNGGLFGISSGVGVGVPGVGPIGVGSGLGIGK
ncbi:unnamed protein product [Caenorhabditis sp. 36 PRJEB53466]|nr:unnamed protein product [Caenorhabditis sp. 36 PRJEB53466]